MATMNISLPDEMKDWVDSQVATGQYTGASDYIRDVLRREQAMLARLQDIVDDAEASGFVDMTPGQLFEDIRKRTRARILETAEEIKSERIQADDAA